MEQFFKLKENGTNVRTEVIAGLTTFFAMAYILFVNPQILSATGMDPNGVFVATIIVSVIGTLLMALFANVPYALAPGMGLNAFFTYTVCGVLGFTWQQALAMVLICGVVNILITVTGFRKAIIRSLPSTLHHAIGGGIGLFIAYIGIKDAGLLRFTTDPGHFIAIPNGPVLSDSSAVPAIVNFSSHAVQLSLIGLFIILILTALRVKGGILIGIIATTIIGIPMGITDLSSISGTDLGTTIGGIQNTAFKMDFAHLFQVWDKTTQTWGPVDSSRIIIAVSAMIAFVLTDIFDALGTFIGTGRKTGIFGDMDEANFASGRGIKTKLDKALFCDLSATVTGAFVGTSNSTTYVESSAGIAAGGRTGLASVVTAIMFALSIFVAPIIHAIPAQATSPALIVVGILMMSSFLEIKWDNFDEAAVAFLTASIMPFTYGITNGIATGFIVYVVLKIMRGKAKEVHPVMYMFTVLFILNFILNAVNNI